MSLEIIRFIALMLPGMIGYRIFRAFDTTDVDDSRNESISLKYMGFGIIGYVGAITFIYNMNRYALLKQSIFSLLISISFAAALGIATTKWGRLEELPARLYCGSKWRSYRTSVESPLDYLESRMNNDDGHSQVVFVKNVNAPEQEHAGIIRYWSKKDVLYEVWPVIRWTDIEMAILAGKVESIHEIFSLDKGSVMKVVDVERSVINELRNSQACNW